MSQGMSPERPNDPTVAGLSDSIWEIFQAGWEQDPNKRPKMKSIFDKLTEVLGDFTTEGTNAIVNPQIESGGREYTSQTRRSRDLPSTASLSGTTPQFNNSPSSLASEKPQMPVHNKIVNLPRAYNGIPESHPQKASSPTRKSPAEWTVEEVVDWLKLKGFDRPICDKFVGIVPKNIGMK
jgi:hypothetical protein